MKKISLFIIFTALFITAYSRAALALNSQVILTCDPNIEDKWYRTRSETVPRFSYTEKAVRKQFFSVLVFFTDYKPDRDKKVNITYDILVLTPDKQTYFKQENIRGIDSVIESENFVLMNEDYMRVCFEPEDREGEYTVIIKSSDNVSGTVSESKAAITLYEFKNIRFFRSKEEVGTWINNYYRIPAPEKAIDAFLICAENDLFTQSSVPPLYTFFIHVFESNPYLIPFLIEDYGRSDIKIKTFILYLFAHIEYNFDSFIKTLPDNEKDIYNNAVQNRLPDPYGEIFDASQLDMLWGIFLSTGKYDAVKKIVMTLDYRQYEKTDAARYLIYRSAAWSLKSNCKQFPLVKDYCRYILEKEQLTDTVRSELTGILAE